jgi:hypothetical protein
MRKDTLYQTVAAAAKRKGGSPALCFSSARPAMTGIVGEEFALVDEQRAGLDFEGAAFASGMAWLRKWLRGEVVVPGRKFFRIIPPQTIH